MPPRRRSMRRTSRRTARRTSRRVSRRQDAVNSTYEPEPQYAEPAPQQYAPPPEPAADEVPAYMGELEQLASLRDAGVLTEDEFEAKKKQILGL